MDHLVLEGTICIDIANNNIEKMARKVAVLNGPLYDFNRPARISDHELTS